MALITLGKMIIKQCLVQNVSEDTDEMFDDLFNKYGKVVFKSNDIKSPTAEVDDDAECLACKRHALFLCNTFPPYLALAMENDILILILMLLSICCSCC